MTALVYYYYYYYYYLKEEFVLLPFSPQDMWEVVLVLLLLSSLTWFVYQQIATTTMMARRCEEFQRKPPTVTLKVVVAPIMDYIDVTDVSSMDALQSFVQRLCRVASHKIPTFTEPIHHKSIVTIEDLWKLEIYELIVSF